MSRQILVVTVLLCAPILAGCVEQPPELTNFRLSSEPLPEERELTWPGAVAYDSAFSPLGPEAVPAPPLLPSGVQSMVPTTGVFLSGTEPSIGITSSGAIFVTALEYVFKSDDHGQTWERVHQFVAPRFPEAHDQFTSAGAMLWVDPDTNRIYLSHLHPGRMCTYLAWSDDEGKTWGERHYYCGVPGNVLQRGLTAKPGPNAPPIPLRDYPNLLYLCYYKGDVDVAPGFAVETGSWCSVSYDGGKTILYDRQVYVPPHDCRAIMGKPVSYPDGTIAIPYSAAYCGELPTVAMSDDNGLTWHTRSCIADEGPETMRWNADLAITPDGTAYMAFHDRRTTYLLRSSDRFETCQVIRLTPEDHTINGHVAVTSGSDGRIAVSYLGTRWPQNEEQTVVGSAAALGSEWHLFTTYSLNADEENATFVTIQVTPDQDPVAVGCITCLHYPARTLDMARDADGRWFVVLADSCTPRGGCAGDPEGESDWESLDWQIGTVIQDQGFSLLAEKEVLERLGLSWPRTPPRR